MTAAVDESANLAAEGVQGQPTRRTRRGLASSEPLSRTDQRRPVGETLDVLERPLHPGCQSEPGGGAQTVAADAGGLAQKRSTAPRRSSPSSRPRCNRKSGPVRADSGTLAEVNRPAEPGGAAQSGDRCRRLGRPERQCAQRRAAIGGQPTGGIPGNQHVDDGGRCPDHQLRRCAVGLRRRRGRPSCQRARPPRESRHRHLLRGRAATERIDRCRPHRREYDAARLPGPTLSGRQRAGRGPICRQANGMAANGDPGSAIAGGYTGTILPNIFVDQGSTSTYTSSAMSAATIGVSSAYLADPSLIATAAAPGPSNSNVIGTATLDSTNAQAMAALAGSTTGPERSTNPSSAPSAPRPPTHRAPPPWQRIWRPQPPPTCPPSPA